MSELQHPQSRSFELVADLYERVRPEYPMEAIAWIAEELSLHQGRTVLDLGAGTGKLTRALVETGAEVIAVEPGREMLAQLRRAVPGVQALHGAAEAIPLRDASVDAVTAGQSFHWFREEEALPEIHRVLRPRGGVGLVWNMRDQDSPFQRRISDLIAPFIPPDRLRDPGYWFAQPLAESELFGWIDERTFRFTEQLDADALAGRIASISFVAAAPAAARARLEADLRAAVARAGGTVDFPYVTSAYVSRAV